jgi:hypothetical protein
MEEELRALLSFARYMAARWRPRRPPLQPPWRKSSGLSSLSRGRWWRGGDLVPSSSTIVEEELEALLSFPRQMSARWGPRHPPLEPLWRMSSGFSSSSRGRWRHNGALGVFLYSRHGGRARGYPLLP